MRRANNVFGLGAEVGVERKCYSINDPKYEDLKS